MTRGLRKGKLAPAACVCCKREHDSGGTPALDLLPARPAGDPLVISDRLALDSAR